MTLNLCPISFWIRTCEPLDEIARQLQERGIISSFEADYENVYEWFEANLIDFDVGLNVSRQHHDFQVPKDEPLHFVLISSRTSDSRSQLIGWTDKVAERICKALQKTVEIGEVRHLGDDKYSYHPSKILSANADQN